MNNLQRVTDEDRWQSVLQRDADADGQFVFAVQTTGIFCRPSCRAKHALRKNVRFFADAGQALAAGFRPCKRCQPDKANAQQQRLEQADGDESNHHCPRRHPRTTPPYPSPRRTHRRIARRQGAEHDPGEHQQPDQEVGPEEDREKSHRRRYSRKPRHRFTTETLRICDSSSPIPKSEEPIEGRT